VDTVAYGRGKVHRVSPPIKTKPLGTQCRWEYNTGTYFEDIWLESGDWFHVAQDMNQ
jgi:hypothetical protein